MQTLAHLYHTGPYAVLYYTIPHHNFLQLIVSTYVPRVLNNGVD